MGVHIHFTGLLKEKVGVHFYKINKVYCLSSSRKYITVKL